MSEDKLYESDYFNIYVCQTYRTQYNKIKEEYRKELCIYLDFESDIFNYLFVVLNYKKKKNTFFTEYYLISEIPYDKEITVERLKHNLKFIKQLCDYLWEDIKNKDYLTEAFISKEDLNE